MVEKVKITPSQILLKDSSGTEKFNTNNYYLKTGSGTLYAGGNTRTPAIYGQNTISDHVDKGYYTPGLFTQAINFNQAEDWLWVYNVPKASSLRITFSDDWEAFGNQLTANSNRTLKYYNYNTLQLSTMTGYEYKWIVSRVGRISSRTVDSYGNASYGESYFAVWPIFYSTPPAPTNPAGGTYEVSWTANEHLTWTRPYSTTDNYGNVTNGTYTFNTLFGGNQTLYWRIHGMFTGREPEALSLAVTP